MRVCWSSRAECVEVVWTHGENGGGPVGEKNSRTQCESVKLRGRLRTGWRDGVKRVLNKRGARKDDCVQ